MNQVIIYKNADRVAVVIPTGEALAKHGIQAIAIKDVPAGKRFKIVNVSDLPLHLPQEVWDVSDADLTDGVGGESNQFPEVVS
jgi:hypothetical protein